ncbi:COG3740 Phage head maturation protease [uncultured Caudovirales phage]|uniref:COG3740 Phage head maturation protease n=1 Tax=uncultured Caudovirales phage TaxID=2100421 RepID=A0A6J7WK21_9CAUD|nr:COG3740 Phage head maturation protease [uncultured Caudovirales phage]
MKQFQSKDISDGIMDVDTSTRRVKAVWSRMNNIDLDSDIIVPEAFTKTLAERGPSGKNLVWSLVDHQADMNNVIGKPEQLYVDGDMLVAITPIVGTEKGTDMLKMYEAGLINQHSIGFSTMKQDWQNDKKEVRIIKELKLYEGSAVLWGANPETPTLSVKSQSKEDLNNRLEKLLKAFRNGRFTDETFALMEIQIKKIQADLLELDITQSVQSTIEPKQQEKNNDAEIIKAIKEFNKLFKK